MRTGAKKYERPHPVISGQTTPTNKKLLGLIASKHELSASELVGEALEIALPRLLKRYPLPPELLSSAANQEA